MTRRILFLLTAVFAASPSGAAGGDLPKAEKTPIQLIVSVYWEGDHIKRHNLEAIQALRQEFKGINFFHFINPAYFTKPGADTKEIANQIKSVISSGDEIGMHLQPWKSLVAGAGVAFRTSPTFWGDKIEESGCQIDCGGEIPLTIYSKEEIGKIMAHGVKVLNDQGFNEPRAFYVGGWLTSDTILEAALVNHFEFDFSAVPPSILKRRVGYYPLFNWIVQKWHFITPFSAPFVAGGSSGKIVTIPNTAGAVDFLAVNEIVEIFKAQLAHKRAKPGQNLVFHLAIHQETALQYVSRFKGALQQAFQLSDEADAPLVPMSLPLSRDQALGSPFPVTSRE